MPRREKEELLEKLKELFKNKTAIYFTDYTGIDAVTMNLVRKTLRREHSLLKVIKNRIAKMALESVNIEIPEEVLKGPTAVIVTQHDPIVPARNIKKFKDEDIPFKIKGAYIEGKFYKKEEVEKLSKIPPREELLSMLVGGLEGVIGNLVFVLEIKMREFIAILEKLSNERR